MRLCLILIIALLLSFNLFGQEEKCCIPLNGGKKIDFWYTRHQKDAVRIGIANLLESKENFHVRFWSETQTVDVWTDDFKKFYGSVACYAASVDTNYSNRKPGKFYSKIVPLDTSAAEKTYVLCQNLSILKIPRIQDIKGWGYGLDGDTYSVEYSTKSNYSFKNYWSPELFGTIKEAVVIDSFYKHLSLLLGLPGKWSDFIQSLPRGCYTAGSYMMTCNNWNIPRK